MRDFWCSFSYVEVFSHSGDPKLPHACLPSPLLGSRTWKMPVFLEGVVASHTPPPCLEGRT